MGEKLRAILIQKLNYCPEYTIPTTYTYNKKTCTDGGNPTKKISFLSDQ